MRYKLFGKHTGLRVSELVLGAGNFGTRWGHGAEPDEARRIFDAYADAGGNFIDTANGYQFGQSEEILGDLLIGGATTSCWRRNSPRGPISIPVSSSPAIAAGLWS